MIGTDSTPGSSQRPDPSSPPAPLGRAGRATDVFRIFLGLGLTSFGGPVAHLGYFREAFVVRRQWLSERTYADLVALCQFLPGPTSSQVGMAIGLQRAGYLGLLAAWAAFTLPSAILLVVFAYGASALGTDAGTGWIQGLKAAAVAVVAHAVLGMARSLAPDKERASIGALSMIGAMLIPATVGQAAIIVMGALVGSVWLRSGAPSVSTDNNLADDDLDVPVGPRAAAAFLLLFAALLIILPILAAVTNNDALRLADGFYRAGSLVFGGGHVVLPLLQAEVVDTGLIAREAFLAGYGAAQAVPGPLFTFAAYLGTVGQTPPNGVPGAMIALTAIFVPSALLVLGSLPFWKRLRTAPLAQRALAGINAAVVGLLAAALYNPVFSEGITSPAAMAIAAAAFVFLTAWRVRAWAVVIGAGAVGFLFL